MRCPACETDVKPQARDCPNCGEPLEAAPEDNPVATIIPYRNVMALLSYYFGVFSLIPIIGAILGLFAVVLGILGLGYVRRHPEAKGTGHAIVGIVLGGLVVLGHLALLVFFLAAV